MTYKSWLLLFGMGLVISCNQTPKRDASKSAGPTFTFSKQEMVTGKVPENTWCWVLFPESAVINADPVNSNRRIFALTDGPLKVTVSFGKLLAAFIMKRNGNNVELFTSDNFPECLSNRVNFTIGEDGTTFKYDNKMYIQFEIQLMPAPNGTQIALEMAPGAGYGMEVRR